MKYTYAYKTSDGQRHEALMEAPSREAVFAALRTQGIKAIKVVAADGSKANGELRGVRKRIVAVVAIAVAIIAGAVAFGLGRARSMTAPRGDTNGGIVDAALPFLTDTTRRQVIGDAAIIEKGIRTGWADVFEHEGERFLASFAIPGVKAGVGTTSVAALEECLKESKAKVEVEDRNGSTLHSALRTPHSIEAQQIIAMVEGMKREARAYLAAGGTAVEYGKRLTERQDAEIATYQRAETEVLAAQKTMSEADFNRLYEQRNDELRNLGIRPITLPE